MMKGARIPVIAYAAAWLAVVGTSIGIIVFAFNDRPLTQGQFSAAPIGAAAGLSDGVADPSAVALTGPTASKGGEMQSIDNDGSFPVRLSAVGIGVTYTWLDGREAEQFTSWKQQIAASHPFPMTIQPHEEVFVYILVSQPRCGQHGLVYADFGLTASVLGAHYRYTFPSDAPGHGQIPVALCPTKGQLEHVSRP